MYYLKILIFASSFLFFLLTFFLSNANMTAPTSAVVELVLSTNSFNTDFRTSGYTLAFAIQRSIIDT